MVIKPSMVTKTHNKSYEKGHHTIDDDDQTHFKKKKLMAADVFSTA